jgi:uncharacterized protein (TIGR01777 family)
MRIAITGATGFVGRRLVQELDGGGCTVLRLGRGAAVPEAEAVVHLAGEPVSQRWNDEVKRRIRESRTAGTRKVVEGMAGLTVRPRVFVCASAVGLYGERGEERLTESAAPGEGFLADVCREWEAEADKAEGLGIRVVKIRIGLVLGKDGGALAKMLLPFRLGLGARLGSGKQYMSWIHLDDLVRMIRFAVETQTARGAWNGVAPNPVTNAEFTRQLGAALHRPALFWAPEFLVKLGAGEMAQILFFSQKCVPEAPLAAGFQFRYPELGVALRAVVR